MSIDRLLIVGWDGADPALVEDLIAQGRLPNLQGLIRQGLFGRLRSSLPDTSLAAWTSAMTGMQPGRHGMVNFVRRQPGTYRLSLMNASERLRETLFSMASRHGQKMASLGIPGTFPLENINGFGICGFDSPLATQAPATAFHPQSLYKNLAAQGLSWPYAGLDELHITSDWHPQALGTLLHNVRQKTQVAQTLFDGQALDLAWVVFSESDTACHHFWAFCDPHSPRYRCVPELADSMAKVYQALDEALGRLLAFTKDRTSVMVISDHGSCGASDHVVYLNRFLAQEGFLRFRTHNGLSRVAGLARDFLGRHLPAGIKQSILSSRLGRLAMLTDGWARFGGLDLANCQAFSDELPQNPGIWIHRKATDPLGCIQPEAVQSVRDNLAERLLAWRQPHTQRPVVARVWPRENAFSGPAANRAPDLLVELAHWPTGKKTSTRKRYRLVGGSSLKAGPTLARLAQSEHVGAKGLGTSGAHAKHGILVAKGPHVSPPDPAVDMRLVDICPTALSLLDLPIPADLDGRIIQSIAPNKAPTSSPTPPQTPESQVYSPEEAEAVRKKLVDLGYL